MTSDRINNSSVLKSFLSYGISLSLAVIFLYIAFHGVNISEVMDIVSNASVLWMVVFALTVFLGHVIRALRWKVILNSVKPNTSFKHLFGALMVGYGVNWVTPKLGEITRAVLLGKWETL
ncbi:MAG: flippase-like domain-containing protein, partial [Bacteroidetes bacterium]|nr:flippase-like domain-containing protein [Bacteroidota bacterium]